MKGIVLAGGNGTRLHPLTIAVSKQLMPVYNKPMIYYPISTLMLFGIRELLIITTQKDQKSFQKLLGDGSKVGCCFSYKVQKKPGGLAEAFLIGEYFIGNDSVALILGDNIFYGSGMEKLLGSKINLKGARIFAYKVKDPSRYGVVELNDSGKVISLEEKPKNPVSGYAVPGLYFYDSSVVEIAKDLKPSDRGELEITEISNAYLKKGLLEVVCMKKGQTWLDAGTFDALLQAGKLIRSIEKRKGFKIGCIKEVAYKMGFISSGEFFNLLKQKS